MALPTRPSVPVAILAGLAVALPSAAIGAALSADHGMCEDTLRAVQQIEGTAPEEMASAVNAVYDSDMQCRSS